MLRLHLTTVLLSFCEVICNVSCNEGALESGRAGSEGSKEANIDDVSRGPSSSFNQVFGVSPRYRFILSTWTICGAAFRDLCT